MKHDERFYQFIYINCMNVVSSHYLSNILATASMKRKEEKNLIQTKYILFYNELDIPPYLFLPQRPRVGSTESARIPVLATASKSWFHGICQNTCSCHSFQELDVARYLPCSIPVFQHLYLPASASASTCTRQHVYLPGVEKLARCELHLFSRERCVPSAHDCERRNKVPVSLCMHRIDYVP